VQGEARESIRPAGLSNGLILQMAEHPPWREPRTRASQEPSAQLDAYSKASTIFSQISGFQTWVMACATLFVTLTAAIWAAILSNNLALGVELALAISHLGACLWLLGILYGSLRSIRARFVMFDRLAELYFPDIRQIGVSSFESHRRRLRWLTSGARGRVHEFFYLLPLSGVVGTLYLLVNDVL
jgi:hypothetical protein